MFVLLLVRFPTVDCNQKYIPGKIQALEVGGVDPPTIEWMFAENATQATGMLWDGMYTGQTEMTWSYSSWVNDSDGVDTVFFQYRYSTDGEWMNKTPSLVEGDPTNGEYSYSFVQEIWWNWDTSRPEVEGGLYVEFRIFANDTLGNWRTTLATFKSGGWMQIVPPTTSSSTTSFSTPPEPFSIPLEILLIIGTVGSMIVAGTIIYRKGT
jgi:hypothetical protein